MMFDTETFEINADKGSFVIKVCGTMMALSFVSVFLRFLSRRMIKQPFLWDDWFILMAIPASWTSALFHVIAVTDGQFGRHAQHATPQSRVVFFKCLYGVQIAYPITIALIKFSILSFFWRIFSIPQTKFPLQILAGIVLAWVIAMDFAGIFSCIPVHGFWEKKIQSTCINSIQYFLGVAIPNIATDVFLLVFPIPLIWKLKIMVSQKVAITGIFLLGGFIVIVSSLRLVTIFQAQDSMDFTWNLLPLGIWNVVETNVGILCACLPSMQPLLKLLVGGTFKYISFRPKLSGTGKSNNSRSLKFWGPIDGSGKKSQGTENEGFTRLDDERSAGSFPSREHEVSVCTGGQYGEMELQEMRKYGGGINVRQDIEWTTSNVP